MLASIGVSGLVVRLTREPPASRPLMVTPALTPEPPASTGTPPPIAAAAPRSTLPKTPVASKSTSPTPSHSSSPSKKPTKKPTAKPGTPPAASSINARYSVRRGRGDELQGYGAVSNTGKASGSWTMTLTFQSGVRITRAYGVSMSSSGGTVTFRGSLAPDKSAMFGFTGEAGRNASIRPVSCSINGHSC
ncbi:cellulose binding domain-containing protein [Actinoplanes sp. NPDC049265]|uniref:cellulose binding domain-containing protein n=1 Tax=Actinoplanes sp. NPDC049265 TaxID=3363902 RepID=UPI00372494DC